MNFKDDKDPIMNSPSIDFTKNIFSAIKELRHLMWTRVAGSTISADNGGFFCTVSCTTIYKLTIAQPADFKDLENTEKN